MSCFHDLLGPSGAGLSLGLILPHSWGRKRWVPNSMVHELWDFPFWLVERATIPGPVWASTLLPLILSSGSFLGLGWSPHMHTLILLYLPTDPTPETQISSFLLVQLSHRPYLALWAQLLPLPGLSAPLLISESPLGSAWASPPCIIAWELSSGSKLGQL